VAELADLAEEIGISITHLALLNVSTVILGASRLSQLEDNLAALAHEDKVTPDVMVRIDAIVGNKPAAMQRF
jgi:aryl-alcohol dehydrogenase-like predicted oxidoreductase